MSDFDYDLFVIGGGSGGVRAAQIASLHGARVGLAEEYRFGGTCVIRGCVPKKLMVYASSFCETFEDAAGYGWSTGPASFDWPAFIAAKDAEIARLETAYRVNLEKAGVEVFASRARLTGAHEIAFASGETFSAKHILVAVGAAPFVPDIPGAELAITSNEIFNLKTQPRRMMIVGGGYIACEFAGIMNGLGTEVHQIYRGPQILRGFDDDIRDHVAEAMRGRGVRLEVERDIAGIAQAEDGLEVTLDDGTRHRVNQVLCATGRRPNVAGLGLDALEVGLKPNGAVEVDEWSQTRVPSIYAVGDVTDRNNLTPVAIREGHAFADTVFGAKEVRVDHRIIPTAIFTQPEAGTVGLTEAEARAEGPVEIYRARFRPMSNILAGRDERMLMKLVVAKDSRKVLGCHLVGHGAGEMIQLVAIPIRMGATKEDFDETMAVHPTAAEELVTMRTAAE